MTRTFHQPAESPIIRQGGCVIAYHPAAREIGEAVLQAGGNAFDAFVAAAVAENVLAEGASSLAGPLGVLTYHSGEGSVAYLDADFNDPLDPAGNWTLRDPQPGKALLVPGAPAGLEALAARYGRLPFADLLQPAIALAEHGFPVTPLMARFITRHARTLKKSAYGRRTFLPGGKALAEGATLRQPEVAAFLRRLAAEGSRYVYEGDWGDRFLAEVEAHGGRLTARDLREYGVNWSAPWSMNYRGYMIHSSSGHSYGGLWALLALKTLEHTALPGSHYYWEDAETLEQMIRIARQVWSEADLFDYRFLDDPERVTALLTEDYTDLIWERVRQRAPSRIMGEAGTHSYHLIVTDSEGNIASGTTTIESDPWGQGIFVEGLPLPTSGWIPWSTEPGRRRLSPFSIHLAFQGEAPRFAVGSISNSVVEAAFQFLVNLIDYQLPVREAVSAPRFGTFPSRGSGSRLTLALDRNWLDPRVGSEIVTELKTRGLKTTQKGPVDTGLGALLSHAPGGTAEGITVPVPYVSEPFGRTER